MKTLFCAFFLFVACNCHAQAPPLVKEDLKTSVRDLLWELNSSDIIFLGTNGNYFYKAIMLEVPANNPETDEVNLRVILLRGEFGEVPDGNLYDLGTYYFVNDIYTDLETRKVIITGGDAKTTTQYFFDLP